MAQGSAGSVDPNAGWRAARNILCVRLDNLGDVIMTGPAMAAVARQHPDTRITLLASPSGAAASAHLPMVHDVIRYEPPWVKRGDGLDPEASAEASRRDLAVIELIRSRHFDAAIIFTVCTQSALPAALMLHYAGIPLRAAHVRENPYGLLTHRVSDDEVIADGMRHEVVRQLDLVRALGFASSDDRLAFHYTASDRDSMLQKLQRAGLPDGASWFVVHPGASAESRRYPAHGFREASEAILLSSGSMPVFVGSASELQVVDEARGASSVSLAGRLGLGELAALIDGADLMLCNNSGPAHIAAARGTPTVVLYALTNPQHTPWRVASRVLNVDVPCRNCLKSRCPMVNHDCLDRVDPREVADAALGLLRVRTPA